MSARAFWQEIHGRFDPAEPVADPAWRVDHPYSPTADIVADLHRPFGDERKRHLVYGTTGAGKSTELLRVAEQRVDESFVILLDLHQHFSRIGDESALQNLHPWEVVFLSGLAVFQAAKLKLGHRWAPEDEQALVKAASALLDRKDAGPKLDLAKLAGSLFVVAGGALGGAAGGPLGAIMGSQVVGNLKEAFEGAGKVVGAAQWNLELGVQDRGFVQDQDGRARALLAAVNRLIGVVQSQYRAVTLVLDGLDRIVEPATSRRLFVDSTLIGQMTCATVVCGPSLLAADGARETHFRVHTIRSLPVMQKGRIGDPLAAGSGVELLVEAYRKRTTELDPQGRRIPEPLLRRLAYYSGGRFRDFVRFIADLAAECWDADEEQATEPLADKVLQRWRRTYEEGLDAAALELLREAKASTELPGGREALRLVTNLWLLPYPNSSIWWAPHPLLLMEKLA